MNWRRRRYLIDSSFQIKLILTFLLISLIGTLIVVAAFNSFALDELEKQIWSVHISAQSTGEILGPLFLRVNIASIVLVAALLIAGALISTKRTSGPLYRMSKDIRKIAGGDLSTTVSLREKDEFQEVAETLNSMAGTLRSEFTSIANTYTDISRQLAALERPGAAGEIAPKDYEALLKDISRLEERLNRFET